MAHPDPNRPIHADHTLLHLRQVTGQQVAVYVASLKQTLRSMGTQTVLFRRHREAASLRKIPVEELLRLDARTLHDIGIGGHDTLCLTCLAYRSGRSSRARLFFHSISSYERVSQPAVSPLSKNLANQLFTSDENRSETGKRDLRT